MKVYVINFQEGIDGIFSTKEKALEFIKTTVFFDDWVKKAMVGQSIYAGQNYYDTACELIQEYEIDNPESNGNIYEKVSEVAC